MNFTNNISSESGRLKFKDFKIIALLIPIVGIIIALMYGNSIIGDGAYVGIFYAIHSIFVTGGIWLGCYGIVTFLWKKFPWERHPAKHIIIEVVAILSYVVLFGLLIQTVNVACNFAPSTDHAAIPLSLDFFITILITFLITSVHEAVFFYKQWKYNFSKSARLEKDNIEAKYETLKSQINPHFLFNSLNSLTLIVDTNKEATNYIQNLSEFLRYVLKSHERELVLVRDEIQMLEKYLSLQKSRFRNNLLIDINVDEKYFHYSLPPLVLQMLAENCIKHNIISKDKPLTIKVIADKKTIVIENNLQKKAAEHSTRNGLKNISARFSFFTSHDVKISETKNSFSVEVPLLTVEL